MTVLTKIEAEALMGVLTSDYRDGYHPVGHAVWSWSANPFPAKKTFSGAVSSLVKKGFVTVSGRGEEACIAMTGEGYAALKAANPTYEFPY